jgi:hypothetical protein
MSHEPSITPSGPSRSGSEIAADLYFIASEDHLRAEKSLILEAARALRASTPASERHAMSSGKHVRPASEAAADVSGPGVAEISSPSATSSISVPRRFLKDFIASIDWHNGHGTPSIDRAWADTLYAEARAILASTDSADDHDS